MPAGFRIRELLGRGGMGEVVLADEVEIGRSVAIKRMRDATPSDEAVARFLREAKIQAQLDHPAIVPVHALGRDADGRPYFTMKRLAGVTLAALLAEPDQPQKKLLRAFVDVCLAIEFAHLRGVIHRDLKPSNIMLGDFGEVYVLDWGVARIAGDLEPARREDPPVTGAATTETQTGQLLGTIGYMAPEQMRGDPITPAADIYALGALLFEILAGEPLHPRGSGALASTLATPTVAPSSRSPRVIAPELDTLCTAALAEEPEARPTARALADQVQQYLDGDRDIEARRAAATRELAAGRAALAAGDRAVAVRSVGRAFVLDPSSTEAAELVMSIVTDEPAETPPELAAALATEETAAMRERSGRAILPYAMFLVVLPLFLMLDMRSWPLLVALYAAVAVIVVAAYINWRVRPVPLWILAAIHLVSIVLFSRLLTPFVLTPIIVCAVLLSLTSIPWMNQRPLAVIGWTLGAVLLPFLLEWTGVLSRNWMVTDDGIVIRSSILDGAPALWAIGAIGATLVGCVLVAIYARQIGRDRTQSQRRLRMQAWHLRHLLPLSRKRDEKP